MSATSPETTHGRVAANRRAADAVRHSDRRLTRPLRSPCPPTSDEEYSMKTRSVNRALLPLCIVCLLALQTVLVRDVEAGGSPANQWMQLQGPDAGRSVGDYVSASDSLATSYRFFVEVPPGLGSLQVQLFDADVSATGNPEWDRVRTAFETRARYQLINPAGGVVQTIVTDNNGLLAGANDTWLGFTSVANPAAGHWEVRIAMEAPAGNSDDLNAIGIRAHDGNAGAGGTELPAYAHSFIETGTSNNPVGTAGQLTYQFYPYVTSGCACSHNDWDSDSVAGTPGGSATFTSRSGVFTQTVAALSGPATWLSTSIAGWSNDSNRADYGIWRMDMTSRLAAGSAGGPYNYQTFYYGAFNAAAPGGANPSANPEANTFRMYLPTDAGTAPVKPYVQQSLLHLSGPNPPVVGMTSRFLVTVGVVNPTTRPIVFSSASGSGNRVIANIPGSGVVSTNIRTATQGAIAGPGAGATGNVTWGPGTIAAGSSASMTYSIDVTPPAAGRRVITGTPALNGTTATYVDETGNTTQARATYLFGPLCELAVTTGTTALTIAEVREYDAAQYPEGTLVRWHSEYEIDNLGYTVYRESNGQKAKITPSMVSGSALLLGQGRTLASGFDYSWWDDEPVEPGTVYWIEATSLKGETTMHGPVWPRAAYGPATALRRSATFDTPSETSRQIAAPADLPRSLAPASQIKAGGSAPGAPSLPWTSAGVKFDVDAPGWYRVTRADLQAAGVDVSGLGFEHGTQQLELYALGKQIPIKVSTDGQAIEFYLTGADTRTTDVLPATLVAGNGRGTLRVPVIGWRPGLPGGEGFAREVVRKDRAIYVPAIKNGDTENWFGPIVAAGVTNQNLDLGRVETAFAGNATLEVTMHGASTDPNVAPDHRVQVSVNGQPAGIAEFDGQSKHTATYTIPHNWLVDGENAVTLQAIGGASDVSLMVSTKIRYQHRYQALDDTLTFTVPGRQTATIGGFTTSNIRVVDITNPTAVREIVPNVVEVDGGFAATVNPISQTTRVLTAFVDDQVPIPARISTARASSLRVASNAADLVIVAHPDFLEAAGHLATLRRAAGLRVAVVDVEDVYDEFSFGVKAPAAIRAFLKHAAMSWSRKPTYAVLFGDGSVDPRDYLNMGQSDYLPAYLYEATVNEAASDDWYADFDLDGVPELAIGRLPSRTPAEALLFVNKLTVYDAETPGAWSNKILLAADANDIFDFEASSAQLEQTLPVTLERETAYRGQIGTLAARQRILDAFNEGRLITNYVGHGSTDRWSSSGLLLGADAAGFTNGGRMPLTVSMNCLNGFFQDVIGACLGEALLKAPAGGSIAVWAPSGVTTPVGQADLNREAMRQFFSGGGTIGDAIRHAKAATGDLDVRRSWILLGDPSMRLKRPASSGGGGAE